MEKPERIQELLDLFLRDQLSEGEFRQLFHESFPEEHEEVVRSLIAQKLADSPSLTAAEELRLQNLTDEVKDRLHDSILPVPAISVRRSSYKAWAAVLAFLLLAGVLFVYYVNKEPDLKIDSIKSSYVSTITPGGNHAVLTLANGKKVDLDRVAIGTLSQAESISKPEEGTLYYEEGADAEKDLEDQYHSIETPPGGEYQVVLSDGTKVWLNAASSLKYPSSFRGKNERKVYLTGEAYFEVAARSGSPFSVTTKRQQIQVLGTSFNVNSYEDEPEQVTTLLTGKIQVDWKGNTSVLSPGQQWRGRDAGQHIVSLEDPEQAIAWKEGLFQFEEADLFQVMRQISRWYKVDVRYEGLPSAEHFTGKIPRDATMDEALEILRVSGVHFKIEGRTLIVTH